MKVILLGEDSFPAGLIIEKMGFSVEKAHTAEEAIRHWADSSAVTVLCDQALPNGGWQGAVKKLREYGHSLYVIVTALQPDHHFWMNALEGGAHDVLVRPFWEEEVKHALGSASLSQQRSLSASSTH